MGRRRLFGFLLIWIAAAALTCGFLSAAASHDTIAGKAQTVARTWTVTSHADSGPGTFRQALLDAWSGDTILFSPASFPPSSPVTIPLASPLLAITQNNLTIDASNAGVILDGSHVGVLPEMLLLDDVSLTLDGGPNLVTNGDFAGLGHWRPWPWDEGPGMTRGLNSSDFHSSPPSYQWSSVARAGEGRTVYDTASTSDPFVSDPYSPGSTVWIAAAGGSTAELRFWYRHGGLRVSLSALYPDGHVEPLGEWWFERRAGWTEAVVRQVLPANAVNVALEFGYGHSERGANGLSITSGGNTVRGLQIIDFPNAGVALYDGAQDNVIGGDRGVGSGPVGQGNLISGNGNFGIGLWGEGTSSNTLRGNVIGINLSGTIAWGGRRDGIHSNGANGNRVVDNWIGGYETGVYLCCVNDGSNTIRGNSIGTAASEGTGIGNRWAGVAIDRSGRNVIGPDNTVAHNGGPGIAVYGPASLGNRITRNSIHENGGPGIDLWEGGNRELAAPLILSFDLGAGTLSGHACANCTIEVFADIGDEGAIYEGQTVADGSGAFSLNKGTPFAGPHVTATGADAGGNSSEFSLHTTGSGREWTIQAGNDRPISPLYARCSSELTDNHLGTQWGHVRNAQQWGDVRCAPQGIRGLKRVRMAFNEVEDWPSIDWSQSEFDIRPEQDALITRLAENGITVIYLLNFWDKAHHPNGWPQIPSRFTTEEEIQRYLEYVRFIVGHLKGRVRYFELWNEPDNAGSAIQHIRPEDYVELVKRVAPVIRDEYPQAKIVVGSVAYLRNPYAYAYLYHLIQSEVMPLVDVVAWHPMYGPSPDYEDERDYYYAYPGILRDIKATAIAHGFRGDFSGDEIGWCSPDLNDCGAALHMHTNITAAKYHTRGVVMHLGEDVAAHLGGMSDLRRETSTVVSNLATVFAGARAESLPVQVQTTITDVVSYTFALADDAHLIAIYNDAPAVEEDAGVDTTLIVPGHAGQTAIAMDPLHSLVQPLIAHDDGQALVMENVRVKDYVLLIRLVPKQQAYLPIIHR